jgi:radical SAM family uncharacterized protein
MSYYKTGYVDPVDDIGALLLEVDKPGRYCGGEYGRLAKKDASLQALIAFPDLYELGMSNQALRIIYNRLNRMFDISCDRAFAPAPDFERLLREKRLPLYGLDTGISLKRLDLLLFTLGYELGITGILTMLDVSGIPLRCDQRGGEDPLVIAGGPAVSNPLPYSAFIDAFWIGEAEAGFFDLVQELLEIKRGGGSRSTLFDRLKEHPNIFVRGKEKAFRAVDACFATRDASNEGAPSVYPVPSMKTVQHHGLLEIMRGCPNGCRFCHAGYWYRPMRQKKPETIIREAEAFVTLGGYREISLSSLSSGDYSGIGDLVDALNDQFSGRHISFQMPSLKVSTFALSLLEKISQTRKSGLTFAVETPLDFWQLAINKQVTENYVVEIIREAKRNGWRGAKFYFMIGLPACSQASTVDSADTAKDIVVSSSAGEETEIVNFVSSVAKKTAMHFNINVGIFVPKPHTPYQWARQLDSETAAKKLDFIRSKLKPQGHKVSVCDPFVSMLEGILSRGDERAGGLIEQAFRLGTRLDPWQEFISKEAWQTVLEQNPGLADEFLMVKDPSVPLPWSVINADVSPAYLRKELEKSNRGELTPPCAEDCASRCGVCNEQLAVKWGQGTGNWGLGFGTKALRVLQLSPQGVEPEVRGSHLAVKHAQITNQSSVSSPQSLVPSLAKKPDPVIWRLLFSFSKEGSAVFHGHLSLVEIFSMALCRTGLDVRYTQGFNPLAKLEIVSPLSVGISAGGEVAAVEFLHAVQPSEFLEKMNATLPEGLIITQADCYCIPSGSKKHSLSSLLWGFGYLGPDSETIYVPAAAEKALREKHLSSGQILFSIRRSCVLAKNLIDGGQAGGNAQPWASYFDIYGHLYGSRDWGLGLLEVPQSLNRDNTYYKSE